MLRYGDGPQPGYVTGLCVTLVAEGGRGAGKRRMAEFMGTPLPHAAPEWAALLVAIVTALTAVLVALDHFLELLGAGSGFLRPYGGLALPLAWAVWCCLLLSAQRDPLAVLVVLLGTLTLLVTARILIRGCKA